MGLPAVLGGKKQTWQAVMTVQGGGDGEPDAGEVLLLMQLCGRSAGWQGYGSTDQGLDQLTVGVLVGPRFLGPGEAMTTVTVAIAVAATVTATRCW